jgi:hypothetical protein
MLSRLPYHNYLATGNRECVMGIIEQEKENGEKQQSLYPLEVEVKYNVLALFCSLKGRK